MRTRVPSLAPLSGLRIWHCLELQYSSSRYSFSSDWTPRLGTSIYHGYDPTLKTNKQTKNTNEVGKGSKYIFI